MEIDLELDRIISGIKEKKAKRVMLQLPDGLKARAGDLADEIARETGAEVLIWAGSNYGACDLAPAAEGVDLLVHFGHSEWR